MSVPVEKAVATTAVRIVMPTGLEYVTPTVKPGWSIEVKKEGEGEGAKVTEISWNGGTIPAGQRDDFTFSAKAPTKTGSLQWKVYQTYQDGVVVAWDKSAADQPKKTDGSPDFSTSGPYSETEVIDDLNVPAESSHEHGQQVPRPDNRWPLALSIAAIGVSVLALSRSKKA